MHGQLRGLRAPADRFQLFKLLSRNSCKCRQPVRPAASAAAPAASHRQRAPNKMRQQAPPASSSKPAQRSSARKTHPPQTERLSKAGLLIASNTDQPAAQNLSHPFQVMAAAGVASRRGAEGLIALGSVAVNGSPVCTNVPVNTWTDKITVKGKPLPSATRQQFIFAVHKPKGYICSTAPGHTEQTKQVTDLLDSWKEQSWSRLSGGNGHALPRMFSVGRLDVQSTGLIFLTNDGDWAHRVAHPSAGIVKEYMVTATQQPTQKQLQAIEEGQEVDGELLKPVSVGLETSDPRSRRRFRIVMAQGRNREVRRLAEAVGLEVRYLKRVRIGGFRMPSDLGIGAVRLLRHREIQQVTDAGLQSNFRA